MFILFKIRSENSIWSNIFSPLCLFNFTNSGLNFVICTLSCTKFVVVDLLVVVDRDIKFVFKYYSLLRITLTCKTPLNFIFRQIHRDIKFVFILLVYTLPNSQNAYTHKVFHVVGKENYMTQESYMKEFKISNIMIFRFNKSVSKYML